MKSHVFYLESRLKLSEVERENEWCAIDGPPPAASAEKEVGSTTRSATEGATMMNP